jgi:flagellar hook-associated protein 1 FlgK
MPSLGSILQIATTGLRTQQQALNVTAHNIANASTEGYSRQRAVLTATPGVHLPDGVFGSGAGVSDIQSVRDGLLDSAYFRELTVSSEFDGRATILRRVEGLFEEPSELGLAAALDRFHSAWSELSVNPSSTPVRTVLRQTASVLTQKFDELASGLDAIRQEAEARLQQGVDSANSLMSRIGDLNRQIVSTEADGTTAGDLRDARGRALAELADLLPVQVVERDNGSMGVIVSGVTVVDGAEALSLEVRAAGGAWEIGVVGRTGGLDGGGRLGGLIDVVNSDLPEVRQGLDDLAAALVEETNLVHRTGTNPDGATGIDFFDPVGVTASSIGLSVEVLADERAIAAGTPDGSGDYRAGANDVALELASLRDRTLGALGLSGGDHYRGLVSSVGVAVRSMDQAAESHRILADQADIRRMRVSGVSVDEELVKMIEFQRAYQASARVISAADEMLQSLLAV